MPYACNPAQLSVEMGVSLIFCLGWPQTVTVLIVASLVTEAIVPGCNWLDS
jgi:hypothetical protein